jgi:NAD(P)-dependent dehydrogenase (short-subunit alcohol dehydrogenase family)
MSEPLAGKVAFIPGGSRGIDRATALKLPRAGADVAMLYYISHEESEVVCEEIRWMGRRTPLGPTLSPEQVADAIHLLCLPESAMITGHTLFVDGGYAISG